MTMFETPGVPNLIHANRYLYSNRYDLDIGERERKRILEHVYELIELLMSNIVM